MNNVKKAFRGPVLWILLALVLIIAAMNFASQATGFKDVPTSEVVAAINGTEKLQKVELIDGEQTIRVTKDGGKTKIKSQWVDNYGQELIPQLEKRVANKSLDEWVSSNPRPGLLTSLLYNVLPFLLLIIGFFFVMNLVQGGAGGGRGVMGFGKSRAKIASKDTPQTTFKDVAGCEEAIEELHEIKEFLAEPAKFQRVGAKIPKGVLLYGPPGTGKTLLARAVAGEAGVPFFSISGSDFVEMFVGVGASRVRDLFEQAKENAPAIVFIDEIDAVGRHRGAGMGGGHDEREQTLNQLLVEMDGFDVRGGVILIAATNRPDVLDPALLRPGRFDRQIAVEAPDLNGRAQILSVHAQGKPMADDVDLQSVARRTPGFTGADLANVLNEAALLTARLNLPLIGRAEIDEAIDRVIAGPQKRTRLMNEHEKLVTAYHEGGHAMVAAAMPGVDPVQKLTILPRGRALGYTMVMPDQDKYSQTRGELLGQMAYMLGGRAAEELIFHDPSTGAGNDIEKATKVARAMVTQYGFSSRIGTVQLGGGDTEPFLGMTGAGQRSTDYSDATAAVVDQEVAQLLETAHQEAFDVLEANREILDELVRQLVVKETLSRQEVADIFRDLKRWPERGGFTGSDQRRPSDIPPVAMPELPNAGEPETHPAGGAQLPPGQLGSTPMPGDEQGPHEPWQPPQDWAPPAWPGGSHQ
ncbi:ATP-dependent zinc metalloprotease FtsH [Aestuariimicrobium sp. p3-SID1156]|uniref:ATP-dependent zinc metalloprotease FtsH n=1 Tax=Aestuariimicrobium sp. p3-SID1156 TaxID=2916038 RepID=UPI00223A6C83|nr:ATP-dependent zinc metalloprotease FtsH [Aestuariimicrobium sp. p3-SID1156]MCT1458594.1 ATP-dependent zinc metalloprotease FtsH [Aestuariimicrobium sp. p3-SID1156]